MNSPHKKRVLMLGYLPPPYFGPSIAYQALMRSSFANHFRVRFLNVAVTDQISDLEKFRVAKLLKLAGFLWRELLWLSRERFDVVCAPVSINRNAFLKEAALLALARACRVPTVLYAHNNNLPDFYERSGRWMQRVIAHTVRCAAGAIVLGERLRFNFEPWLPPERIRAVAYGIEPAPSAPVPAPHTGVNVLYLGNLIREKGVFVLLQAARQICARRSDIRFTFAGAWFRSEDEKEARAFVAEHGLDARVRFVGPVAGETKTRVLAEADLLAFPTFYYYETFGLVLLEAMQAGLPVVATRRVAIPEIVRDGVNGLLIEEQDPQDLAAKIEQLADAPSLRAQMSAANRERFASYYTHEHYGRRMIEAFEALAAK